MNAKQGGSTVSYTVTEQVKVPRLSLILGYGPMLPFVLGAACAWTLPAQSSAVAVSLTSLWGGAILAFLAGVRRGLAFRSPGNETLPQFVTMLVLFVMALGALAAMPSRLSVAILAGGFASIAVMDRAAARREEAPPYFARLRPPQMLVAVVSLMALLPKA